MESKQKRQRSANFTAAEKDLLLDLVVKYKHIVENKATNAVTVIEKSNGWQKVASEFNAVSNVQFRSPTILRNCWDNLKKNSRKNSAARKAEILKTGKYCG